VLSRGRLVLGVGAGWLREEFDALAANFEERGSILEEWLEIARACWTGSAGPYEGRHYRLPEAIYCRPVPVRVPPVLIGGMSRAALERAGRIADGWVAQFSLEDLSEDVLATGLATMQAAAAGQRTFRAVVRSPPLPTGSPRWRPDCVRCATPARPTWLSMWIGKMTTARRARARRCDRPSRNQMEDME